MPAPLPVNPSRGGHMMERRDTALPAGYSILVRPDLAYWLLLYHGLPFLGLVVAALGLLGTALVDPVSGVWLLGPALVGGAGVWAYVQCHAGDFERLTVVDDRLILESHDPDRDERVEFNSRWVQLVAPPEPGGGYRYLAFRCSGREVPFGRYLNDEERALVGREIGARLARLRC